MRRARLSWLVRWRTTHSRELAPLFLHPHSHFPPLSTLPKAHNEQEQVQILAAKAVIEAHQQKLSLVDEMKAIHSTQAELLSMLADAKSMELQYMLKVNL